ncbi:hypothetical protein [Leuconostoc sp.]|uniref:hypothetical protein n=1 Tax=Leuconostoc sp. TaxID=1930076 RepID=UPI00257BF9CC|nr:hypothetical protein [Leuconostoc sp.]
MEKEAPSSAGARLVAFEKGITCRCVFVADCALDNVQSLDQIRHPPQITNRGGKFTEKPTGKKPSFLRGVDVQRFNIRVKTSVIMTNRYEKYA